MHGDRAPRNRRGHLAPGDKGRTAKAPAAFRLDLMAVFSKPDLEEGAAVTSSSPGMPPVRGALRHTE